MPWREDYPGSTRAGRARRDQVLARDPVCRCTGCRSCSPGGCARPSTEDDHTVALALGGCDGMDNHRGLCRGCHRVKTAADAAAGRARSRPRVRPLAEPHPGVR